MRWVATCSGSETGPRAPTANGSGASGVVVAVEGAQDRVEVLGVQGGTAQMQRCWAPEAGGAGTERRPRPRGHPPLGGEHLGAQGARGQGGN